MTVWGKLKRWLGRFLVCAPAPSALPMNVARQWLPSDQMTWKGFLGTPTGICLIQRMRCVAAENARAGATDTISPAHSAGRSTGFYDALEWLDSQARIEFEQTIPISGADADPSATSAHQLHGEAELRERYSP